MSNPYVNPPDIPFTGSYTWEPPTPKSGFGSDSPIGFNELVIERGTFRNDLPVVNGTGTANVTTAGALSSAGSENNPILAAFRPLQSPTLARGPVPSEEFSAQGKDLLWKVALVQASNLSAITLTYELTVDITDPNLPLVFDKSDQTALAAYLKDPVNNPRPTIDWTKYALGKLSAFKADGTDEEFPTYAKGKPPIQLIPTGFTDEKPNPQKLTVRFGTTNVVSDYIQRGGVSITNRYQLDSLTLKLQKVLLFNAAIVNIPEKNLPCLAMSYAYYVNYTVIVGGDLDGYEEYPNIGSNPTLYLKVWNPDTAIGSPGFAHGVALRFGMFALADSIGAISGGIGSVYRAIFLGPVPGTRDVVYTLTGQTQVAASGRLVPLDYYPIPTGAVTVFLDKSDVTGTTPPGSSANWTNLTKLTVSDHVALSPDGPFVAPYLYLDLKARTDAWYRVRQQTSYGAIITTQPYQNIVYSEKTVFNMTDGATASDVSTRQMIVRRPTLVTDLPNQNEFAATPIAIFYADDDRLLVSPATVGIGTWSLRLRALVDDPTSLVNSHIMARFFLMPESAAATTDAATLQAYLNQYELSFDSSTNQCLLVMGKATNLQNMMISPPLTGTLEEVVVSRYVEGVLNSNGKVTSSITFNFGGNQRARLMVALYSLNYLTDDGKTIGYDQFQRSSPVYSVEIDSDYASIDTTFQQTLSGTLFPVQTESLTSAQYKPVATPLYATRSLLGGGSIAGDANSYISYSGIVNTSSTSPLGGLSVLGSTQSNVNVYLPLSVIPQQRQVQTAALIADFATSINATYGGRVRNGVWEVDIIIDIEDDFKVMDYDFRLEAFLVSADGTIMYRVFRSAVFQRSDSNVNLVVNVGYPFEMDTVDFQLVVRLTAYPYALQGAVVTTDTLKKSYPKLPIGLRIKSLEVKSLTLDTMQLGTSGEGLGSPSFYEDLPIVPPNSVNSQGFWYVAWDQDTQVQITTGGSNFQVLGTFYSPTWLVVLPSGIEVKIRAAGLGDNQLYVRTVPYNPTSESQPTEQRVSAARDKVSKEIHVAYNGNPPTGPTNGTDPNNLRHIILKNLDQSSAQNVQVTDSAGVTMPGTVPQIMFVKRSRDHDARGDQLAMFSQVDGNFATDGICTFSTMNGEYQSWAAPQPPFGPSAFSSTYKSMMGFIFPTATTAPIDQSTRSIGWADPGALLLKVNSPMDSLNTGTLNEGDLHLVDGNGDATLGYGQTFILPSGGTGGTPSKTCCGIANTSDGRTLIAYPYDEIPGSIWLRIFDGTAIASQPTECVSLRSSSVILTQDHAMKGITLAWSEVHSEGYIACYCGGKILFSSFHLGPQGCTLQPMQIVGGSTTLTDASNSANSGFQSAVSAGVLKTFRDGSDEPDVQLQCPAIVEVPELGTIGILYKNSQDQLTSRQLVIGGVVGPATIAE